MIKGQQSPGQHVVGEMEVSGDLIGPGWGFFEVEREKGARQLDVISD
jgi:hypothetical protein